MPHAGMSDPSIAYKCSASLKHEATTAALAACESVHPQLRQIFLQACQEAVQAQSQVAQLMTQRGWYVPLAANAANMGPFMQNLQQWVNMAAQTAGDVQGVGAYPGGPGIQGTAGYYAGAGTAGTPGAGAFGGNPDQGYQGNPGNRF